MINGIYSRDARVAPHSGNRGNIPTTLTKLSIKITWLPQWTQKEHLTKFNIYLWLKKKTFNSEYRCHVTQCNRDHIQQAYSECHSQQWKTKSFSSKIRNKTRMFTLATFILHSIGNPSYSTYSRKRNKYNPNGKEEKWSLFADNIYYIKKLSRFFKPKISIN